MEDLIANTDDSLPQGEPITADSTPPPDTGQTQPEAPTGGEEAEKSAQSPPESYALDLGAFSEGMAPEELEFLGHMAQGVGISQEQASELMQRLAIYNQATQDFTAQEWAEEARNDEEIGGAKFEENVAHAKQALDRYGTPELKAMLARSPLGNNKEIIRFLKRVNIATSADGVVRGGGVPADNDVRNFFPNTQGLNP